MIKYPQLITVGGIFMARKKKEERDPAQTYNPYFGKTQDESHMPRRPFFTWLLVLPGLGLGLWLGLNTERLLMGLLCGAVLGIALGSVIDKWREGREE